MAMKVRILRNAVRCNHCGEGIVVRPTEPVFFPLIGAALSMKAVSNKYLLKNEG